MNNSVNRDEMAEALADVHLRSTPEYQQAEMLFKDGYRAHSEPEEIELDDDLGLWTSPSRAYLLLPYEPWEIELDADDEGQPDDLSDEVSDILTSDGELDFSKGIVVFNHLVKMTSRKE